MKKLLKPKLNKTKAKPKPEKSESQAQRVTKDTVSEHRDAVLKKGRRFKYPFHRSKHRVAIISVILVVVSLLLLGLFTSYQLYRRQSTGTFTYRVTQIFPFPVASVNGWRVSYESYLFELNSSLHWQEKYGTTDLRSPDGQRQIEYWKQQALDKAIANTIAKALAKEHDVSVDEAEVDEAVERVRSVGGELDVILSDQYGFGEREFRRLKRDALLREKVAQALDEAAPRRANEARQSLAGDTSFAAVAQEYSDDTETKQNGGDIGVVEKGRANVPKAVEDAIFKLKKGETSGVIETAKDYYIVRVTEKPSEDRARVSLILIRVRDMSTYLKDYQDQDKIKKYIEIEDVTQDNEG